MGLTGDIDENSIIGQYASAGFIAWYCFLGLCCGLPICCCGVFYGRFRYMRRYGSASNDSSAAGDWDVVRIQRNVNIFSRRTQKLRHLWLINYWKDQRTIVNESDIQSDADEEEAKVEITDDDSKEFDESSLLKIRVPIVANNQSQIITRYVSTSCAICLGRYRGGDAVVSSSNINCPHAFHEECIATWLASRDIPLCPCCRRPFIVAEKNKPLDDQNKANAIDNNQTQITQPNETISTSSISEHHNDCDGIEMGEVESTPTLNS